MRIPNKKALFDYTIIDKFEAGINLTGPEVKAVRQGHVDLAGSFVRITGSEAYLTNAKIYPYEYSRSDDYDQARTRKLLLHRREILTLKSKIEGSGLTIVPISVYTTPHLIKVEIALVKGKKEYKKKEAIKSRDIEQDVARELEDTFQ